VAQAPELDFERFVSQRKEGRAAGAEDDGHGYAYVSDKNTRAGFERLKPVELAVAACVRMFKNVGKAQLLGSAVKVGPNQFPRVHALTRRSADCLGIAMPTVYVVNNPYLNGATYGTNDDAFIMINSALVDHLSDEELLSVIGHECGHIHNNHVVYLTTLHYLTNIANMFVKYLSLPALLALRAWSRRAEITSDRAGALCVGDMDVSMKALCKLALGSRKLYDQLNIEVFLEQHEEAKDSVGRYTEILATHPWLPKRMLALRAFGESELYRKHAGLGPGGLSMEEVDEKVHEIIKVVG
jgi:Zn-dependent protease with chaperone function